MFLLPPELKFKDREEAQSFFSAFISENNISTIAGLDECGRGPLCGEVVAACVILPENHGIKGIKDSKRLSPQRRAGLSEEIMEKAIWAIGSRSNEDIDRLNIREATFQAATDAALKCFFSAGKIDYLFCDGSLTISDRLPFPSTSIIKGDDLFEVISAASIIAKVYRDSQMAVYHEFWPEYGWNSNSGYGTQYHVEAIKKYGITPLHRCSFGVCRLMKERENDRKDKTG